MSVLNVSETTSSSPEAGSGSPGTVLRRCREFHGISLEEASDTTKIGISHLKALENDQIREFANQAYLKGFLRIYATYLGLNSEDVARMYGKLFGVQGEKPDPTRASPSIATPPRRFISLKKMVFPAILLVVILITASFLKRTPTPVIRQSQPTAVVSPPLQDAVVQSAQSSARVKKLEQDAPPAKIEKRPIEIVEPEIPVAPKHPVDVPKSFILKIKATQSGTLSATVDGTSPQQYELVVGDVIEWKAEKKVALDLSDAGGVDVELNGKPYKSLGAPGKPVYVELDADGIKQ